MHTATPRRFATLLVVVMFVALMPFGESSHANAENSASSSGYATQEATEACDDDSSNAAPVSPARAKMTLIENQASRALVKEVTSVLRSGDITLHVPENLIATNEAKVYSIETATTSFTSVTYPVGGDYSMLSNVTVVLDEKREVVQYAEAHVSENAGGTVDLQSYVDGKLVLEEQTDIPYVTDAELRVQMAGGSEELRATPQTSSTTACLVAVLGVSATTAAILAFFCSGACATAVTPPTAAVCAACIAGFTTIGGASISAVASCFN